MIYLVCTFIIASFLITYYLIKSKFDKERDNLEKNFKEIISKKDDHIELLNSMLDDMETDAAWMDKLSDAVSDYYDFYDGKFIYLKDMINEQSYAIEELINVMADPHSMELKDNAARYIAISTMIHVYVQHSNKIKQQITKKQLLN